MNTNIKFIVGKADRNISAAVRGELISLLENNKDEKKIIYIVPDQFEYETEKAVYRILENKSEKNKELLNRFFDINITTFTRLCREILESCGELRPFADDIVKNIIMHKTVSEHENSLKALSNIAAKPGFCEKMVKTISALKTSGITARDLDMSLTALASLDKSSGVDKLSTDQPVFKKLDEINTLYTSYEAHMEDYVDKLDITAMAADNVEKEKCDTFEDASVFVDCFNDFTQSQLHFLECVSRRAKSVTFGFTTDYKSDCDVFRTANAHISRLKSNASDAEISSDIITEITEGRYDNDSPLVGLAEHLFQNSKNRNSLGKNCELVSARSVYEELDYVAAKIKGLTISKDNSKDNKKLRYNEIAVLCTDVGAYGKVVESVFGKYDIPFFLDTPEPILYQPLVNLVSSVLNALNDFSVDTVLSCVKTKFFCKPKENVNTAKDNEDRHATTDKPDKSSKNKGRKSDHTVLSEKDIDEFESYVYEWDLKASHLKKPFTFINKKVDTDYTQINAEKVRKLVVEPLLDLRKCLLKNGKVVHVNGAELTKRLYDFLVEKVDIECAINLRCHTEQNKLSKELVDHYQRLWDTLVDIFNKLYDELSNTTLTIADYGDLFREICAATKLADPPQLIDCVLVGDIDRTRADNIKAAFIVGASYDAFPTPATESGIFSQYEIERIYDKIVHIENNEANDDVMPYINALSQIGDFNRREYCLKSAKEQHYLSLYRAYRAITLPTEYLCISCPQRDISGEMLVYSDIFAEIRSTFNDVSIIAAESLGNEFYCRTAKAAKLRYAMGLNEQSMENRILRKVLEGKKTDNDSKEEEDAREFVKALDEIREIRMDRAVGDKSGHFSGEHSITSETARLLFPRSMGATLIENLNSCKFNFFCQHGLKIKERNKRSFTRSKRGDAMHYIFEKVLGEYSGDMNAFFALKRSELLSLTKKYLSEYRENETNNDSAEDRRTEYLFNNIANSAADVLITMQTELFKRRYRPKFFELNIMTDPENSEHSIPDDEENTASDTPEVELFSTEKAPANHKAATETDGNAPYLITAPLVIKLDEKKHNVSEITVQGVIDRIDMFTDGEKDGKTVAYIRIVDYKSSTHEFDLRNVENGINIQMLLYLFALQDANRSEDNATLELHLGGVSYIPSNNNGASEEELSPYRLLAMNYHESGLFIKDDVTTRDLEKYLEVVNSKLESDSAVTPETLAKIKKTFEPSEINMVNASRFEELRKDVMQKITDNLNDIFSGKIDALPTLYSERVIKLDGSNKPKKHDPCEYCRFKEICRNTGTNVNRIEKPTLWSAVQNHDENKVYWVNKYIKEDTDNVADEGADNGTNE